MTSHLALDQTYARRFAIGEFDPPGFECGLKLPQCGGVPAGMAIFEASDGHWRDVRHFAEFAHADLKGGASHSALGWCYQ
jgi:hypothetical protein